MNSREYGLSVSRGDWTFDRSIQRDEERHNDKVKEAIKGRLEDIVSDGTIITADPHSKRKVAIPMRSLELPHIRYGEPKGGIGTGDGTGQPKPGDKVGDGREPGEAGEQPGEEYYEAEMTIEEIQQLVFADLGLPNIRPRGARENPATEDVFDDIRKKRTPANIHLGRTAMENIRRNAMETGIARIHNISIDDFRVRTWEEESKPINSAVVLAMADISASMGEFEKYVTRAFCWWAVSFLRSKYPKVDIAFIAHDTEAHEVTEEQFFTRGAGGGTKCSSANAKALEMIDGRFQTSQYNVYPLHFSDGDNQDNDNMTCVDLVQQMLDADISQYAYLQIGKPRSRKLFEAYREGVSDDRFKAIEIETKDDVLSALKQVFTIDEGARR